MNDCVWSICARCEGECNDCSHYLSMNSIEGATIFEIYQYDTEIFLQPLFEKYLKIRDNFDRSFCCECNR